MNRLSLHAQRLWSPAVRDLKPYVPGEQPRILNLVKLNTNESPVGPSPRVREAILAALDSEGEALRLYPDPDATALRNRLASYHGLTLDQVFVGNGSDEVLAHAFMAFFRQSQAILFPDITYSFYPVYCQLYGVEYRTVPLEADFAINPSDYRAACGGVILPNPNAPTGRGLPLSSIRTLLEQQTDCVVIVDEAYIDFGGESAIALIPEFDNLLVVQTASKSRGLAGLRVGMAFGQAGLIEALGRIKDSFNSYPLDRLAQVGVMASLDDDGYFQATRHRLIAQRELLTQGLTRRGFRVVPSQANFVFATHPAHKANQLLMGLREQGVIVRHFDQPRTRDYLRITVGIPEHHKRLFDALDGLIGG